MNQQKSTFISSLLFVASLALSNTAVAVNTADLNAEVVFLRKDCGAMSNCFDNMETLLDYIWGPWTPQPRIPSANSPLLVDIGPGKFDVFNCSGTDNNPNGWVTLRGAGQKNTRIENLPGGDNAIVNNNGSVSVKHCTNLSFQDLTVGGDFYTIAWTGGGTSTWTNVEVDIADESKAQNIGWYETFCDSGAKQAVHYWFGSRITTHQDGSNRSSYFSCGDTWFYGGEITTRVNNRSYASNVANPIQLVQSGNYSGVIHLFGTAVRIVIPNGNSIFQQEDEVVGVFLRGPGTEFHMHGGIISIDASGSSQSYDVTAVQLSGGVAHTPDTAFVVKAAGNGTASRVKLGGVANINDVQSPYLWPAGENPPTAISPKSGEDQFVENDCSVSGNCNSGGFETHLMIANPAKCGAIDPWFDTQVGECRVMNTP